MSTNHNIVTWNIEWLGNLLQDIHAPQTSATQKQRLEQRLSGIYQAINEISPDVLCIVEGPAGENAIEQFTNGLDGFSAVKRPAGESYYQGGQQWIWFLVRDHLLPAASLLPVEVWHEYTEAASPDGEHKKRWPVHRWGSIETITHGHYRHPQVLRLDLANVGIEIIGGHFKSKLTKKGSYNSADEDKHREYIEDTLFSRVKLGTEAQNVRYYIDQRFRQEPAPAIMVLGDFNDGPGKELFERQFLFFDLLNNLQGDVFEAERFLNHALFDYPKHLRWTAYFKDKIEPARDPHILLDHIMFTQAFVRGNMPLQVPPHAGKVEHEIVDRISALLPSGIKLSDHKPVSCLITES